MKYMVISDIHGNINSLERIFHLYDEIGCEKLLVLGDLPNYVDDSNLNIIINILNSRKDCILLALGNCDSYITGLEFNAHDYLNTNINNKKIFLTHGHLFNRNYLLNIDADIIFTGHTHIAKIERVGNKLFVNPGSISKSRLGDNSFCVVDNNIITIRNLNNKIIDQCKIEN